MSRLSFMTVALYLKWMEEHSFLPDEDQLAKTYDSLFQELKKAGYQWVDLSSWELDVLGINRILTFLQNYGLRTSSYIHFEDYAELEKDMDGAVKRACVGADKAAILGSEFVMVGVQDRGNIREADPVKIRERLTFYLQSICDYAKTNHVLPVIENIPDSGLYLTRWEDVRAVMDEVPYLGYIFDSGTLLVAEEKAGDYLSALEDRLVYVHLKDMKETNTAGGGVFPSESGKLLTNAPTGKGLVDIKTVLKQLDEAGYQGRFSVEFFPDEDLTLTDSIVRSKVYLEEFL